jgi:hypothetical protein
MKKLLMIVAGLALIISCKKKEKKDMMLDDKYTCVCHVSISFSDHNGEADTFDESNFIYSNQRSDAEDRCERQGTTTTSASTIGTKTCVLQWIRQEM